MVIAYLRVSTGRQHLENQKGEIERYTKSKGITIDRWVTEIVSGKTDRKNRKLGRIVSHLRKGDMLIVTELSRLSRSLHEIMQIMKHCVDNQVTVYSTKDGYSFDDSINSKVLSFAFGLAAEIEHKLISQRTREAMALRKLEGLHMGRKKGSATKMQHLDLYKEEIAERLLAGEKIGEICRHFGVSYNTFHRYRKENSELPPKTMKKR
ncbi:MAG: recombinase family protein [Rikenellaceae bacterium]